MPTPKDPIKYQEWKKKIRLAHKGMKKPWAGRYIRTEETKKRISEALKRRKTEYPNLYKLIGKKISKSLIGKKLSEEHIRKLRIADRSKTTGKNHWNWKGGISYEPYSIDWTETLKRAIRQRDKYTCQICGKEPAIHCHHIDYNKKNCNPKNLIILCNSCNIKVNFSRNYWENYLSNKLTEISTLLKHK